MSTDERTWSVEQKPRGMTLRSNKIRVEVVRGVNAGAVFELPGPEARIGTARTCDVALADPTVSREHVLLRVEGGSMRVLDGRSKNGTWVDGVRIRDAFARPDSLLALGDTTLRLQMLDEEVETAISSRERFGHLLGSSVAMRRVFAVLERAATSRISVLIEGESGTGKELAANGIHKASSRSGGPFVVFDCSAVPSTLVESELLGHVRGAFTGAVADRRGRFEEADGGTLFLDEIGELPLDVQPKLLRVLETSEVRRLGDSRVRRVDVRIVAATNRSLLHEVDRGRFREDLYYRLAALTVRLPPLRERAEDIPMLARHFHAQLESRHKEEGGAPRPPLSDETLGAFGARSWPGNVRELRNAVERAVYIGAPRSHGGDGGELWVPPVDLSVKIGPALRRLVAAYTRAHIAAALEKTGGNKSQAATLIGTTRQVLQKKMTRFGMTR